MAKLTISDAARVAGVARSTLHRAIHAGRLSADADGHLDTAELLRAGYMLQRSAPQEKGGALQDATPRTREAQQPRSPATIQDVLAVQQERDLLRREMEAAHAREQAALAREQEARDERQAARDREARLLHMVEQMQHRYDRLLEAPRPPPAPAPPGPEASGARTAPPGAMRRRIVALLREYPQGLTPAEIRTLLRVDKRLSNTCLGMLRDGLVQRVGRGKYVAQTRGEA